jgi:hypothetical protein
MSATTWLIVVALSLLTGIVAVVEYRAGYRDGKRHGSRVKGGTNDE